MLGHTRGGEGGANSHQWRLIAGGDDHDTLPPAIFTEVVLQKLVDFATPFTNQGNHTNIGRTVAGHHAHRDTLADTGSGEDAKALANATS